MENAKHKEKKKEEKEERVEDVVLQFIGYMSDWQSVEGSATFARNALGERMLLPRFGEVILIHPRVVLATTKYGGGELKKMIGQHRQLLRFTITVATEDDILVAKTKKRFEKNNQNLNG